MGLLSATTENRACGWSCELTLPGELLQSASSRPELQALTGLPPSGLPPALLPTPSPCPIGSPFPVPLQQGMTTSYPWILASPWSSFLSLPGLCYLLPCSGFLFPESVSQYTAGLFHDHLAPSCSTPLSSPTSGATAGSHHDGKA